jgi:hypothetical protein
MRWRAQASRHPRRELPRAAQLAALDQAPPRVTPAENPLRLLHSAAGAAVGSPMCVPPCSHMPRPRLRGPRAPETESPGASQEEETATMLGAPRRLASREDPRGSATLARRRVAAPRPLAPARFRAAGPVGSRCPHLSEVVARGAIP